MNIYIGTEHLDEGYDATVTTKIELFATEKLAKDWVNEIKSDNVLWREYEIQTVVGS